MLKPAYSNKKKYRRTSNQHNKTLYVHKDDVAVWDRAARLLPFHIGVSVSQFCTEKIKEIVAELEAR